MNNFRYPGVKPFETSESTIFFGREKDIAGFFDLVQLEKLVVLFGKSGYGKSSLLNAGIISKVLEVKEDNDLPSYIPIPIRLGLFIKDKSLPPLDQIKKRLAEEVSVNPESNFLQEEASLWHSFKRRQSSKNQQFLLIFDQFEEFFSYPISQQNRFKESLAEVIYTTLPQSIRDQFDTYSQDQRRFLSKRLEAKAVFAIRSDRISELDSLKDRLPAILYKRYELKGLSPLQAKEAIVKPAGLPQESAHGHFLTPAFTFDEEALNIVISELSKNQKDRSGSIESFQLQILCQHIEAEVIAGHIVDRTGDGQPDVMPENLPDISNVYEAYYYGQLNKLKPKERKVARELIENGLIYLDQQSGEARRLSMDADVLVQQYSSRGASHDLLKKLQDTFLLRREPNTLGGYNYELSHDSLLTPVTKAKTERETAEQKRITEQRALEAEAKAKKEKERAEHAERLQKAAERGRRRATMFSMIALMLLLVAGVALLIAYQQNQLAQSQREIAERALETFKREEAAKDRLKYDQLIQRGDDLLETGYPSSAIEMYIAAREILNNHLNDPEFKGELEKLIAKIRQIESRE